MYLLQYLYVICLVPTARNNNVLTILFVPCCYRYFFVTWRPIMKFLLLLRAMKKVPNKEESQSTPKPQINGKCMCLTINLEFQSGTKEQNSLLLRAWLQDPWSGLLLKVGEMLKEK